MAANAMENSDASSGAAADEPPLPPLVRDSNDDEESDDVEYVLLEFPDLVNVRQPLNLDQACLEIVDFDSATPRLTLRNRDPGAATQSNSGDGVGEPQPASSSSWSRIPAREYSCKWQPVPAGKVAIAFEVDDIEASPSQQCSPTSGAQPAAKAHRREHPAGSAAADRRNGGAPAPSTTAAARAPSFFETAVPDGTVLFAGDARDATAATTGPGPATVATGRRVRSIVKPARVLVAGFDAAATVEGALKRVESTLRQS